MHAAPIFFGWNPPHQLTTRQTVNQTDRAVVPQLQAFRELTDGHVLALRKPFDGQQCLMLLRRNARSACGIATETKEFAECVPQRSERFVVLFFEHG